MAEINIGNGQGITQAIRDKIGAQISKIKMLQHGKKLLQK